MHVQAVVDRVMHDQEFAREMVRKTSRLTSTGELIGPHNDDNWREILEVFADGPDELARLTSLNQPEGRGTTWTITVTSVGSTAAGPAAPLCVTLMTTMTTAQ